MPAGITDAYAREIGQAIARSRESRQMTQYELSRHIGRSKNAVSDWERGKSAPTVESLRALCHVLQVTPAFLLGIAPEAVGEPSPTKASRHVDQLSSRIGEIRQDTERSLPGLIDGLAELEEETKRLRDSL